MAFGIICEYNPLHTGHLHQINEIKRISDEPIICVMSGHLTQRGEIAIFDKYSVKYGTTTVSYVIFSIEDISKLMKE